MDVGKVVQDLQDFLKNQPLQVRTPKNMLSSVMSLAFDGTGRPGCIYVWCKSPNWAFFLYPGSKRFQELICQLFSEYEVVCPPHEDPEEQMEAALIRYLTDYNRVLYGISQRPGMKKTYIKVDDGSFMVCQYVWQRVGNSSRMHLVPAKNWEALAPYIQLAFQYSDRRLAVAAQHPLSQGLYTCPDFLVDLAEFDPYPGMSVKEAMDKYPSGTHVRSMECLCEYQLIERERALCWVSVVRRCEEHVFNDSRQGWLLWSDQVEIVRSS